MTKAKEAKRTAARTRRIDGSLEVVWTYDPTYFIVKRILNSSFTMITQDDIFKNIIWHLLAFLSLG
jgi:hypothetical protein